MTLNFYSNRQQDVKDSQIEVMGKQENINFAKKKNTSFLEQPNLFDRAFTEDDCENIMRHNCVSKESSVETCHFPIRAISGGRLSAMQDKDAQTQQII